MNDYEIEEIRKQVLKMRERIDRQKTLLIRSPYYKERLTVLNRIDKDLLDVERSVEKYINELEE